MNKSKNVAPRLRAVTTRSEAPDRSRVSRSTAERYCVTGKNGFDHANIFLVSGRRGVDENWGSISILSSFGDMGYSFTNIGPRSFKQFLSGLNCQYLSEKLLGEQARVFDLPSSIANMKKAVCDAVEQGELTAEHAEEAYLAFEDAFCSGIREANGMGLFLEPRCSKAFMDLELWHYFATVPNPQALGFWEEVWTPFVRTLREEVSSGSPQAA